MSSVKREIIADELVVSKGIKMGQDSCVFSHVNPIDIGIARIASNKSIDGIRKCLQISFRQETGGHDVWGYLSSDPA